MSNDMVRQNINYLRYPLWFQHLKHDGEGYVWKNDIYEVRTGYKAPDYRDAVMLYYLLKRSQDTGWKKTIEFVRADLLKNCGLPTNHTLYYKRILDSLKRWKSLSIFFKGKFYRDGKHHEMGFGIIESYDIKTEGRKNTIIVEFNSVWLNTIKNIESYYSRVSLPIYSALSSPGARRLYEILLCEFSGQPYFCGVEKFGEQMTIGKADKKKGIQWDSHVIRQMEKSVAELNRVMSDEKVKSEVEPKDIFTVTYKVKKATPDNGKETKTITFFKHTAETETKDSLKEDIRLDLIEDFLDTVDQDWDVDFSRRKVDPPDEIEKRAYYKSFHNVIKDPTGRPIGVPKLCVWVQDYRVRMSFTPG